MKKVLLAVVAVFAVVVMGAEAKKTVGQLWSEGGWTNWTEVIKQAESGAVETKGREWLVELARYKTKAIDATELWKRCKDHSNAWSVGWEIACRILRDEPADSAVVKTVKADLDSWIAGQDKNKKAGANIGYGRYYWIQKDYAKAYDYYLAVRFAYGFAGAANVILNEDSTKAPQIAKDIAVVMRNISNGEAGKMLLNAYNKSAVLANIPAAEVVSTLTTIQRLYADRAVGDSKEAKEWGIFLGSLRDVIASWK